MMSKVKLFVCLSVLALNAFPQSEHPFNIWQVSFFTVIKTPEIPALFEFSNDETAVYLLTKQSTGYVLEHMDLSAKRTVRFSIIPVEFIASFKMSPSGKSLLITDINDKLFYIPNAWAQSKKIVAVGYPGSKSSKWINDDLIGHFGRPGDGSPSYIFSIERWESRETQQWERENGNSWRSDYEEREKLLPRKYYWQFETVNSRPQSGLYIFLCDKFETKARQYFGKVDYGVYGLSKNHKFLAYVYNNQFLIAQTVINSNYKRDSICFTINNYWLVPELEKNKLKTLLRKKDYIEVHIVEPKIHPVTNKPIGAGVKSKAIFQVYAGIDSVLYAVLISKDSYKINIQENDFVGRISSEAKLANDDLGEKWGRNVYQWNLDAKVRLFCQ